MRIVDTLFTLKNEPKIVSKSEGRDGERERNDNAPVTTTKCDEDHDGTHSELIGILTE